MDNPSKDYRTMVVDILHTANWIDKVVTDVLSTEGITHIQFNVLRILEKESPLSVNAIKAQLVFKKSDITRLIDRLENKGLVRKKICIENKRKMDVSISETGLSLIMSMLPKIEYRLFSFFKDEISIKNKNVIIKELEVIRNKIKIHENH